MQLCEFQDVAQSGFQALRYNPQLDSLYQTAIYPMSHDNSYRMCAASELPDPGSMGFEIERENYTLDLFIVHKDGEYFAYRNSCPHTGAPLEWQEHQFLDMDKAFIQCSTHDALFEIPTGLCIKGPCVGASLTGLSVEQRGEDLYIIVKPF